ncbi:MAG: hypothetical protein ABIS47_09755 [Acidimicrobiales bacterium]
MDLTTRVGSASTLDPLNLPNLTRIVVHGETLPYEHLRLTIDPGHPALFGWARVPVTQP